MDCHSSSSCSTTVADQAVIKVNELEAAEALADFAQFVTRENGGGEWGSKGKRGRKRVETPCDSGLNRVESCCDLGQQENQWQVQTICKNVTGNSEESAETLKANVMCSSGYGSYCSSRARQHQLTEEEKEARRVRRVLANRESARQTIRRRQALCEELTRKASDLLQENENLKKQKELIIKEHQILETTNKQLKAQMAKLVKVEPDNETKGELKSSVVQIPIHPTMDMTFLLYNQQSFQPLCWPPMIQSSHPLHDPIEKISSSKPENPINLNGHASPIYLLPYPWFLPLSHNGNEIYPQTSSTIKSLNQGSAPDTCFSVSSSPETLHARNQLSAVPMKVKSEAFQLADLNEVPPDLALEECDQILTVKHEEKTQAHHATNMKSLSREVSGIVGCLTEKSRMSTVAAAEARKRRKELTKLKSLHGRQCRMNC